VSNETLATFDNVDNLTFSDSDGAVAIGDINSSTQSISVVANVITNDAADWTLPDNATVNYCSGPDECTVEVGGLPGVSGFYRVFTAFGEHRVGDQQSGSPAAIQFDIGGTTAGARVNGHDQIRVPGEFVIVGDVIAEFRPVNGYVPRGGERFVIVTTEDADNGGVGQVDGTFVGLPEGATINNFLGSGIPATITYQGGDGGEIEIIIPLLDFGDALTVGQTLLADNGPRHPTAGPTLGALRDTEFDGVPSQFANGDDADTSDDEDGLLVISEGGGDPIPATFGNSPTLVAGTTETLIIDAPAGGLLDGWIDYNGDGVFSQSEHINQAAAGQSITLMAGSNDIQISVPPDITRGVAGLRLRISTTGGLSPVGGALDGEVEDHLVDLQLQELDVFLAADANTITRDGDDLVVSEDDGDELLRVPFAAVGTLTVLSQSSSQTVVDLSNGQAIPVDGLTFQGDGGDVRFTGAIVDTVSYVPELGRLSIDGREVSYPTGGGTATDPFLGFNIVDELQARVREASLGPESDARINEDGQEFSQLEILDGPESVQNDTVLRPISFRSPTDKLTILGEVGVQRVQIDSVAGDFVADIEVFGLEGGDELTVKLPLPDFDGTITFDGGTGGEENSPNGDQLILLPSPAGPPNRVDYNFLNLTDGSITTDNRTLNFLGLEPIIDSLAAAQRTFTFAGTDDDITLSDDDTGDNGMSRLSSVSSSETVIFSNPTNSLTINAGNGADRVTLAGFDETLGAAVSLTVNGEGGGDTLVGSTRNDALNGGDGDDFLEGGDGNDQLSGGRGTNRIQGDGGSDTIVNPSSDDTVIIGTSVSIDLRVVSAATSTDANGQVSTLPDDVDFLDEWDDFFIEVWGSTPADETSAFVNFDLDLRFDNDVFSAVSATAGPAFTESPMSNIDNADGLVELNAGTVTVDAGRDQFLLLGRVAFNPTSAQDVANDQAGRYILPTLDTRFLTSSVNTTTTAGTDDTRLFAQVPEVWPVMYDLDDNGSIGFGDVARFVEVFGASTATNNNAYSRDFDRSGIVSFADVALFAQNFGSSRDQTAPQSYPGNFPAAWRPVDALLLAPASLLAAPRETVDSVPLNAQTLRSVTDQAIDLFAIAGLNESGVALLQAVEVTTSDLPSGIVGLADGDRILIDIDAAGVGWLVDPEFRNRLESSHASSQSQSIASRRIDLLTVIAHEFGHILGLQHREGGGLMDDSITPGERRLPSAEDFDQLDGQFAELTSLTALLDDH